MTSNEKKIQYELLYPNLEWLFGRSLNLPEEVFLKEDVYNGFDIEKIKINCNISFDNWNENKPIYRYICDYENGEREIVNIPLMEIIEKWNDNHNLKLNDDNYDICFDDIKFVIMCIITNKLKLIN
jgi:hypothetical protein